MCFLCPPLLLLKQPLRGIFSSCSAVISEDGLISKAAEGGGGGWGRGVLTYPQHHFLFLSEILISATNKLMSATAAPFKGPFFSTWNRISEVASEGRGVGGAFGEGGL